MMYTSILSLSSFFFGVLVTSVTAVEWSSPDGQGNFFIQVSEQRVEWGTKSPLQGIMEYKEKYCGSVSCFAGDIGTEWVTDGISLKPGSVLVDVETSTFASTGDGVMENMIEVIAQIMANGEYVKSEERTYGDDVVCPQLPGGTPFCPIPEKKTATTHFTPKKISVRFENDGDGDMTSQLNLIFQPEDEDGSVSCEDILGTAELFVGVVKNIAPGFALANLICKWF